MSQAWPSRTVSCLVSVGSFDFVAVGFLLFLFVLLLLLLLCSYNISWLVVSGVCGSLFCYCLVLGFFVVVVVFVLLGGFCCCFFFLLFFFAFFLLFLEGWGLFGCLLLLFYCCFFVCLLLLFSGVFFVCFLINETFINALRLQPDCNQVCVCVCVCVCARARIACQD